MVSARRPSKAEEILARARAATVSGDHQEAMDLLADSEKADTDGRFTEERVAALLSLVSAIAMTEGQTPSEYAVHVVRSTLEAAVETAMRDASEGVEALGDAARANAKLAPLVGEHGAAVFHAAIGYQTAAALRVLGRRDEAVAAYDEVIERHLGSPDPKVQYWLGMCLYNCADLLLEPADAVAHNAVRGRAFALVDRMFDVLGASTDPDIRARLARAAALEVSSLVAIGRIEEASDAFQRFAPDLAGDHTENARDFERWRCVVGQTDAGPMAEDLLRTCALGEGTWQGLASLELGADPEEVASANPELLTDRVAVQLAEIEATLPDDQAVVMRRNLELLQPIAARGPRPSLNGPLEGLVQAVGVRLSLETACEVARRPHFVRTLASPYVETLCALCDDQLDGGDWRHAWQFAMVLRAAAERLPLGKSRDLMIMCIGATLLRVAAIAWASVPDRRIYDTALEVGSELLALGVRYDEAVFAATVHESLACMLLAPYVRDGMGEAQYFWSVRRWADRLGEEVTNLTVDPEPERWEIPRFADDLAQAETHVRAALAALPAEHSVGARVLLQDTFVLRGLWGHQVDVDARVVEAEAMLDVLAGRWVATPDIALRALLHVRGLGGAVRPENLATLLGASSTELRQQWGDAVVRRSLIPAAILALHVDRDWGLRLLDDHRDLIESADEDGRLQVLRIEWMLLAAPRIAVDFDDLAVGPIQPKLAEIDEQARTHGWSDHERTRHRLAAAGVRLEFNAEGSVDEQELLGLWITDAQKLVGERTSAMAGQVASMMADMSTRAMQREDWATAIGWLGVSIAAFLDLRSPDGALEGLTLVDRACERSEEGLGRQIVDTLTPLALQLDVELGARATRLMDRIWQHTLRREFASGGCDGEVLLALLQLSKGLRFAAALHADEAVDPASDGTARRLLSLVQRSESQLEALGEDQDEDPGDLERWHLDDLILVTPYDEQLDPLPNPTSADLLENLQRSFDACVQRLALGNERSYVPISTNELSGLVPESSAVLVITFARDPQNRPAFVWMLATPGRPLMAGTQENVDPRNVAVMVRGRWRMVDPVGAVAWGIRSAMQLDPAGRSLNPEGRDAVDDALETMLGPGVGILRDLLDEGLSHLVVVPHGGLHFIPFSALHLDGRPLVERLTVTTLPNLGLLRPRPTAERAVRLSSIGLDFADRAFGLASLPEAIDEARAVAELFGTEPLLPPDATESAMVSALQSASYVHVATHGEHAVPAPSFQRIYAIPSEGDDGRLAAYELMGTDLRGLRLVTLSACETALGRVDLADNLMGVPAVMLLRGAETVVGTLWEVETTVSQDFFVALYQGLREGLRRGEAFAQAQREIRRTHPQYRDWAAFQFLGDWR